MDEYFGIFIFIILTAILLIVVYSKTNKSKTENVIEDKNIDKFSEDSTKEENIINLLAGERAKQQITEDSKTEQLTENEKIEQIFGLKQDDLISLWFNIVSLINNRCNDKDLLFSALCHILNINKNFLSNEEEKEIRSFCTCIEGVFSYAVLKKSEKRFLLTKQEADIWISSIYLICIITPPCSPDLRQELIENLCSKNRINQTGYLNQYEKINTGNSFLNELNELTGLNRVKKEVTTLINMVEIRKIREKKGIKQSDMSLHLVFTGNPGTGKTTVARLLGKIYRDIGVLSKGHLIETDRAGMVGEYIGHTAQKTKQIIEKAKGGILFIDEAYSLTSQTINNDFGQEAVDTLLKEMEDNRDKLIVIVAGYSDFMNGFLKSNPGLQSRFNNFINFEDYTPNELLEIFLTLCKKNSFSVDPNGLDFLKEKFEDMYKNRDETFANGRTVRNYFEKTIMRQANRLAKLRNVTDGELQLFTIVDLLDEKRDVTK